MLILSPRMRKRQRTWPHRCSTASRAARLTRRPNHGERSLPISSPIHVGSGLAASCRRPAWQQR
eukprot:8056661-Heterocapsa_arctica.AAC.1